MCNIFILFFFFNDTATTEIYTLSLHDALPISIRQSARRTYRLWDENPRAPALRFKKVRDVYSDSRPKADRRSEEHTSELQSLRHLVCRLLLEKKKQSSMTELTPLPTDCT